MNEQLELFLDLPMKRKRASKVYGEFTDKFKVKLTTDDCYTPEPVYNAVRDWTVNEFGLEGREIVRPFWPGGDFETYDYTENCVVIDNPPFSIFDNILKFYTEEGIDFMLFGPSLTLFKRYDCCYIVTDEVVTYANGAKVNTSFVTSLDKVNRIRCDRSLRDAIDEAEQAGRAKKAALNVIKYPECVVSSALLVKTGRVDFRVRKDDCAWITHAGGNRIYGSGFLLSDRAAAERAAAERAAAERAVAERAVERKKVVVQLLPEELEIIRKLNEKGTNNGYK